MCRRQKLRKRYVKHDSRNRSVQNAEHRFVENGHKHQITRNRPQRLGKSRQKRVPESLAPAPRRKKHGRGHGDSLRNVVYGDGSNHRHGKLGIVKRGNKGRKPLRNLSRRLRFFSSSQISPPNSFFSFSGKSPSISMTAAMPQNSETAEKIAPFTCPKLAASIS